MQNDICEPIYANRAVRADGVTMIRTLFLLLALLLLSGCGEPVGGNPDARILLMGDSMMASNRDSGQAVADLVEQSLGQPVIDRAVVGARYLFLGPLTGGSGLNLPAQYRPGPWDWVVLNGGGNDLLFGCGCGKCDRVLDRLIAKNGAAGAIPAFVAQMRKTGAKVIYVGYMRNPGVSTPIKACRIAGDELDRRLTLMAGLDPGITFVPLSDLVPYGDTTLHQIDRIHPSAKGSRAIADRIARQIAQ